MNRRIIAFLPLAPAILVMALWAPAAPASGVDLGALLQQTGLNYSSVQTDVWVVPFDNGSNGTMKEYVLYSNDKEDYALIFVTVVDRPPHYVFSDALLTQAMKLNNDKVGIKFVLDDKYGDIDCQTEVYLPTATPASLKLAMDDVASEAAAEWQLFNKL